MSDEELEQDDLEVGDEEEGEELNAADDGDGVRLRSLLEDLHPADVADLMGFLTAEHRAVVVLSRREIATREFGPWDMAARTGISASSVTRRSATRSPPGSRRGRPCRRLPARPAWHG